MQLNLLIFSRVHRTWASLALFALALLLASAPRAAAADVTPVLDYADLASAPAGAWVTVWGWNLGKPFNAARLYLGEQQITQIAHWSDDRIDFRLPAEATSGALTVRIYHWSSNALPLTVRAGAIYHVNPAAENAADANPGSEAAPWRTLARAAQAQAGDTVYIHAGIYNESLIPRHSGTAAEPIAFKAWPGERPIIDGSGLSGTPDGVTLDGWNVRGLGHVIISGLTLRHLENGIQLVQGAHDCGLFDLEIEASTTGVLFYGAFENRLARSRISTSEEHGIALNNYSSDLEIIDCQTDGALQAGVYADASCERLTFTRVTSEQNGGAGFELHSATTHVGESNARHNALGLSLAGGATGQNLVVWDNAEGGIRLGAGDTAATTTLVNCTIAETAGAGIEVAAGIKARLRNLIVVGSGGPAILFHDGLEHGEVESSILQSTAAASAPVVVWDADADPAQKLSDEPTLKTYNLQMTDYPESLFVDYAGGNFELAANSPARRVGQPEVAPVLDAGRRPRAAQNGLVDAGAYAFDPNAPSAADGVWAAYE